MIKKIKYKKKLFAIIVRAKYRNKKGLTFFTPNNATQQFVQWRSFLKRVFELERTPEKQL